MSDNGCACGVGSRVQKFLFVAAVVASCAAMAFGVVLAAGGDRTGSSVLTTAP